MALQLSHLLIPVLLGSIALNVFYMFENFFTGRDKTILNWMLNFDDRFDEDFPDYKPMRFYPITEFNSQGNLTSAIFLNGFVRSSLPFVIRNGTHHWLAHQTFKNKTYLNEKIGEHLIEVEKNPKNYTKFAYFKRNFEKTSLKYSEFLDFYQDPSHPYDYYWAEADLPEPLLPNVEEPHFSQILDLQNINIWQGSAGTESLPHTDDRDNIICQVMGQKHVVLVPPTQRKLLYPGNAGSFSEYPPNYSPINFNNPDLEKYPDFANVKGKMNITLNPGDMLYIPVFWWHHVRSSPGTNIAVTFWYTADYMHVSLYSGIEDNRMAEN